MPDAFEILKDDHVAVERMVAALETSPGHSARTGPAVLAARREVAQRLVIDSSRHEAAEERYFWPAVRERMPDGDKLADTAIAQEQEAKEALARLDQLDADDDEFDQVIAAFISAARRHIEFEETRVWPGLRGVLTPAQAGELGEKLSQATDHGPTRPHPHTPADPGVLNTAGPVVAAVDRLRDAVTGDLATMCALHTAVAGHVPAGTGTPGGPSRYAARAFALSRSAPREARLFVSRTLRQWGDSALTPDAAIIAGELAANAFVHARTGFTVAVSRTSDTVRISVRDSSPLPGPRHGPRLTAVQEHGLGVVAAVSSRWAAEHLPAGKAVWAELERAVTPTSG